MTRRPARARAYAPDPAAPGRPCEHPGCTKPGEYRAPKSRTTLNQYWWFCLEHVREYNASWDFYKGMSAAQIEAELRRDTGWQRPTWPLGNGAGRVRSQSAPWEESLRDPLGALGGDGAGRKRQHRGSPATAAGHETAAPEALRQPLRTLGLDWPVSLDQVKARYKELAKQHHPDANGGDRSAEERLKGINLAYSAMRSHFAGSRLAAAV